jgi:hypothetical protein
MADSETPGRYEVTEGQINTALERVQRSFPAIVVSYDAQTMRAEVQPALRIRSKNGQQTTPTVVTIPVDWMSWGDHVIQGVLTQGDEVIVECMDRNWLAWLEAGGVADYNAIGGRQAGYAVAKPRQLSSGKRPGPLGAGEAVKIGKRDGSSTVLLMADGQVRIQSGDVRLGSSAGVPLAVARDTDDVVAATALVSWGAALATFTAGAVPNPWVLGVTPVGDVAASSTEVTST